MSSTTSRNSLSDSSPKEEQEPQPLVAEDLRDTQLSRQPTLLLRVQSSYSFFNEKMSTQRTKLALKHLAIYALLGAFVLSVFSIYWGSMYRRSSRYRNLRMLVVIEDDVTIDGVEPLIGDSIRELISNPTVQFFGDWHVFGSEEFGKIAAKHNNENRIEDEVVRQIHQQKYWLSIYVRANASYNYYQALEKGDTSFNTSELIWSIYETGRDFTGMNSYVTPNIKTIGELWTRQYSPNVTLSLADKLDSIGQEQLTLISQPITFNLVDRIPFTDAVLLAPSQVGLIYMIIITFFNFNFFSAIHQQVAQTKLKKPHFLVYRVLSSVVSFFVLALFFSFVSLAFQVDFTPAFGHAGFLVYWMTAWLTMWAVGLMNEIMAMLCITVYPPLLGFWMLFWVVINISPTFTPLALEAKFFRYGYALPIHASYEITKVIFFNTTKAALGRNYAILIIWDVLTLLAMGPVTVYFGKTMQKKAIAEAKAKAAAAQAAQAAQEQKPEA